jgi:lipopolysaccharide transport system permease protein
VSAAIETSQTQAEKAAPQAADGQDPVAPPETVIERRHGWRLVDPGELWRFRELLWFLAWRDIKVRYKQTVLGAAWAVLQPLATMFVFSLFFGRAGMTTGDTPYSLFVFAGLLPWFFFSNSVSAASQSVIGSQSLVTKVYFPRLFIPMGATCAGLVDFGIAFVTLLGMMLLYGVLPGWGIVLVPVIALFLTVASLGVGILLSALTVAYRDFRFVVPFMVQLWMFATPSVYMQSEDILSERWQTWLPLNPAQGLIAAFRSAMLGQTLDWYGFFVSAAVGVLLLVVGCLYFRRVESTFADTI